MFIDGIKAVVSDGSATKVWRFRNDTGVRRHFCVVLAHPNDQSLIRASIRWCLFAIKDSRLKAALVHLTDSNGETWIFDRQGDQFRCFRNRQLFDGRWDVCLKELFRDYAPIGTDEPLALQQWGREFELRMDAEGLLAIPQQKGMVRSSPWERTGLERMTAHRQVLEAYWGGEIFSSRVDLGGLFDFGDGVSRRLHAMQQQSRDVDKVFQQMDRIDSHLCRRLEVEVELLGKIEALASPLMDPAKTPRVLQERLREIDTELQALCERWGIKSLPPVTPDQDWSVVLQALTRYLACDKLEKAARKTLHDARTHLRPAYEEYRKSIMGFLQNDKDLIRELENCLKELNEHVRLAASEQEKNRDNLAGKLNKLLGLGHLDAGLKSEGSALGPHSLDQARSAVNQCLQDISRLYGELENNQGSHDSRYQELEERYEKILSEFGKAREQWLQMAKDVGISADIGVKGLVEWIQQQSRIQTLHHRRVRLQDEIQDQRAQLKTLLLLLADWRTHTGSQKPGTPEIATALSEARNVLLYAEKKREQLAKLKAVESTFDAYQAIRLKLDRDREAISKRWAQGLEHWGLSPRALDLEGWDSMVKAGREYILLDQIFREVHKPLRDGQIFGPTALDGPLAIFTFKNQPNDSRTRGILLQHVEHADDGGLGLLLTEDRALFEMIRKLGVSYGELVEEKLVEGGSAPTSSTSRSTQKPLVSDRARAALEVFAQKQVTVSR